MSQRKLNKETKGAWVVHHGRKLLQYAGGAAEFPAIDEAAKAASLLARLSESQQATLSKSKVKAVATGAALNPGYELDGLLSVLERKRLVEVAGEEVTILGVTTRAALTHAADMFDDGQPNTAEQASLGIAERVSEGPARQSELFEEVGDDYQLSTGETRDLFDSIEQVGFVDSEDLGGDRLLFNGNLFRRDNISKASRVLASLNSREQQKMSEASELLQQSGCVPFESFERKLGGELFEKLRAAGVYDLNIVGNEFGEHIYVTAPGAFHKFVDPLVDDCFDLAKSLVAALTYGMTKRSSSQGRISQISVLLGRLISGYEVGPATAIGQDYRVLELSRVVELRQDEQRKQLFFMRLLKREVGELALQVLTTGDAAEEALKVLPSTPISIYTGPEEARVRTRRSQKSPSKRQTRDVLEALRGGSDF